MNSKILVFALSALGIVMAFFMGRAAGQGQLMHIALVFGVMIGAPLLLSLGKNYWYLIPASLLSGLPAVPFGGRNIELAELSIILCFGIFISRVAFKLDKLVLWRATHIPIYLYIGWVLFIFCLYPVGLAVFGAATMGARFYIQLVLAFMAFIVIASRELTEKDCKWMIGFILAGSFVSSTYYITSFLLFGPGDEILNPGSDTEGFYTWHQNIAGPALAATFLLFAWKKPSEVLGFKNPLLLLIYLCAIVLVLLSGKRTALAAAFLAPLVAAIVFRQYFYLFAAGLLAVLFSGIVVWGHGSAFVFPLQVQRTLSWMPAQWDSEFRHMESGADSFRASLRRFAVENIKRDPIIGKGFAIEYSEIIGQMMATRYVGGGDSQAAPYAIGRAWHNTWLGYAADFGIPLSFVQALIYITVLIVSFRAARSFTIGSPQLILSIYILIYTTRDILVSHVVGHSSLDAWHRWWMYGLLFSLFASIKFKKILVSKNSINLAKPLPQPGVFH
jgi:hypothetical protein